MDSNTDAKPSKLKKASIYFMGFSYIAVGVSHFLNPDFFFGDNASFFALSPRVSLFEWFF